MVVTHLGLLWKLRCRARYSVPVYIAVKHSGLGKDFLYYYLKSTEGQNAISAGTVGAVQPKLPLKNIQALPIPDLQLGEQKIIADTLSALDDKIEQNMKINHLIEQITQAIFKSWFVDFEPWGGVMPGNWQVDKAEKFFSISIGKTPPRKEPQWFTKNSREPLINDLSKYPD